VPPRHPYTWLHRAGLSPANHSWPETEHITTPRPSDERYVHRFVNEVVQDREALENATPTQACAFFRRWSLERWDIEEKHFSAEAEDGDPV